MTRNVKRFIVLGDAGAGKSSFINAMFNFCYGTSDATAVFDSNGTNVKLVIPCKDWVDRIDRVPAPSRSSERDINDQTKSQTMTCTTYKLEFEEGLTIELIDTPGFNDTDGVSYDESNLQDIENSLGAVPYLSGLIVVINGASSRIGTPFRHFLHLLYDVWPNSLMRNVCVILTNCDDLSCNVKLDVLRSFLKVDTQTTFHLQNSLFRWDRKNRTSKTLRHYRQEFEDAIETLEKLIPILVNFADVSTNAFEVGAIKKIMIERCIDESIEKMIELLRMHRLQRIANDGIEGADRTMLANKNWEKQREITAIKWMEVEPVPQRKTYIDGIDCNSSSSSGYSKSKFSRSSSIEPRSSVSNGPSKQPTSSSKSSVQQHYSNGTNPKRHSNVQQQSLSASFHEDQGRAKGPSAYGSNFGSGQSGVSAPHHTTGQTFGYNGTGSSNQHSRIIQSSTPATSSSSAYGHAQRSTLGQQEAYGGGHNSNFSYSNPSPHYSQHHYNSPTPMYRAEQCKIQVTLPDNEAISHHETARHQATHLQKMAGKLAHEQQLLLASMHSLLDKLAVDVKEMRAINIHTDLIEKNKDLLRSFRDEIKFAGDVSDMLDYYNKTVQILSKPPITVTRKDLTTSASTGDSIEFRDESASHDGHTQRNLNIK